VQAQDDIKKQIVLPEWSDDIVDPDELFAPIAAEEALKALASPITAMPRTEETRTLGTMHSTIPNIEEAYPSRFEEAMQQALQMHQDTILHGEQPQQDALSKPPATGDNDFSKQPLSMQGQYSQSDNKTLSSDSTYGDQTSTSPSAQEKKEKKGLLLFLGIVVGFVILVIIAIFAFGLGFHAMASASMQGQIPVGSLVVTGRFKPSDLSIGDIITFVNSAGESITHTIIGYTSDGFVTRGSANSLPDPFSVTIDQIHGRYLFHIPVLGHVVMALKHLFGF